jgi:hypothetical protein
MKYKRLKSALSLTLIAVSVCACSIEKPQAPSWDTEMVLPLISHQYDMLELVDRMAEDALSYDSLGNITFSAGQEMDTVAVDACLSVADLSTSFAKTLGSVDIPGPQPISEKILLSDHLALGGDVPAMTIDTLKQLPTIPDIESATVSTGSMIITAANNFDLPLDTVTLTIVDATFETEIGTVCFEDGLSIGETESQTIDLSGKTISSSFVYRAHLYTPGGTILTVAEKTVEVEVRFSSTIRVSSATARIQPQEQSY